MTKNALYTLRLIILISAALLSFQGNGQKVTGLVMDLENETPLPGANVTTNKGTGTTTDANGFFHFATFVDTITVSYIGYETLEFSVAPSNTDSLFIILTLRPQAKSLGEVVVSAGTYEQRLEDVTVSLDVINPELAQDKNQTRLQDVLQQAPGVVVTDETANIRSGSGWSYGTGTRVQTLVDYMPLISGDAGQSQWELAPIFSADRIEVLKGASSVLYGSAALNGVIHLLTHERPTSTKLTANIYSGIYDTPAREELKWWDKSRTYTGFNADWQQPINDQSGFVASASVISDEGFRYLEEELSGKFFGKYFYSPKKIKGLDLSLAAHFSYIDDGDALLWESDSLGYIPMDSSVTKNYGLDFYIDPVIEYRKGKFKHALRNRYLRLNNNSKSDDADYTNSSDQFFSQYTLQYFLNEKLVITGGVSVTHTESHSVVFVGKHTSAGQSVFAQADAKPWKWLNLNFGMRYENFRLDDATYNKPVFRGGMSAAVTKGTHLRASYGESFRFPAISETYTSTSLGPITVYPNEDLEAESGYSYEAGVRQMFRLGSIKGYLDMAYFNMQYENMIEYTFGNWGKPGTFTGLGFKALNVGSTTISGIDISTALEGNISPNINYRFLAGYTYSLPRSKNPSKAFAQDNNGNDLNYINTSSDTTDYILKYRFQHSAKLDLQLNLWKCRVGASMRYNSFMQNIDQAFNQFISGVSDYRSQNQNGNVIFDFRIGVQPNREVSMDIILNNAFNEEQMIRPGFLAAPRSVCLRATLYM